MLVQYEKHTGEERRAARSQETRNVAAYCRDWTKALYGKGLCRNDLGGHRCLFGYRSANVFLLLQVERRDFDGHSGGRYGRRSSASSPGTVQKSSAPRRRTELSSATHLPP